LSAALSEFSSDPMDRIGIAVRIFQRAGADEQNTLPPCLMRDTQEEQDMARIGRFLIAGLIAAIAMVTAAHPVSAQHGCTNCGTAAGTTGGGGLVGNAHIDRLNSVPTYHHHSGAAQLYQYGQPDLFSNYYVGPYGGNGCAAGGAGGGYGGAGGGYGAALYMAPHPIPPHVGHTFYTYEPFMPHEMLYRHNKTYHYYYNGGRGMTRAAVTWR
jgi:hypothetical protein